MNSQDERQKDIEGSRQNLNDLKEIIQSQCKEAENLCKQTGFAVDSHAMEDAKKYAAKASKLALNAQIRMEEFRRQHHEEMDKLQNRDQDEKEKFKKQLTDLEERVKKATNSASVSAELVKKIENPITLDTLNDCATLILKFATASGFLFLFFFICTIHWMPIGVSLSETGGILMLGLGAGLFITFFGVVPSLLAEQIFYSSELKKWYRVILFFIFLLFVGVIWTLTKIEWHLVIWYLLLLVLTGLIIFLLKAGQVPRKDKRIAFYLLYLLVFILSVIVIAIFHKYITILLGFSKSETAIQLSESDFKLVQAQVRQREITDIKCDEENRIVWPVRVHLRGIGTHSLISFYHPKKELKKKGNNEGVEFLRMEVKTDESKLIGIPHDKGENCYNPSASAPTAASAATSLEAVTASTEAIYDDDKMNPNL